MKFILLILLLSSQAFAGNICDYTETIDLKDAFAAEGVIPKKIAKNHKRFTFREKRMIHLTISQQDWYSGVSQAEALEIFGDYFEGEVGFDAGEIIYYQAPTVDIVIVHYWPGNNEVGAIFVLKNDSYKLLATIEDGFIECK